MVLRGKEKALEEIPKSNTAFVGRIVNVQRKFSSLTMPPVDHYSLEFDHDQIRVLRGRVYRTMIQFDFSQLGEGICAASNDLHRGIKKNDVRAPSLDQLYVVCLENGNAKEISKLIEIDRLDAEELVQRFKSKF